MESIYIELAHKMNALNKRQLNSQYNFLFSKEKSKAYYGIFNKCSFKN